MCQGIARLIVFFFTHCARADQFSTAIDCVLRRFHRAGGLAELRMGHARAVKGILNLARGLRELRLRLAQCDLRIGRIEFDQNLSGFDLLVFIGHDRLDRTDGLRIDHHHIARNVGVFGGFVIARVQEPVRRPRQTDDQK